LPLFFYANISALSLWPRNRHNHAKELVEQFNKTENGCAFYELFKSGDEYVFMEMYAGKAALDAHGKTDYFGEAMVALKPLLAGAPDVQSYKRVS